MTAPCWRVELGRRDFDEIWRLQKELVRRRQQGAIPDVVLFVEHPPTYTMGRSAHPEHVLAGKAEIAAAGAVLVETDRGGDVTFHGPGQLVGYPIFQLEELGRDVHLYLRMLEEALIRALARFGVAAHRIEGATGVWTGQGKIAAMGIRVSRWVSSHGFALNVSTDLADFNRIVPCGIVGGAVASMESVLHRPVALAPVRDAVAAGLGHVFDRTMLPVSEETLRRESHVEVGKTPTS